MPDRRARPWVTALSLVAAAIMAGYAVNIQYWMRDRELGLGAPGLHMLSGLLAIIAISLLALVIRDWLKQRAQRRRHYD